MRQSTTWPDQVGAAAVLCCDRIAGQQVGNVTIELILAVWVDPFRLLAQIQQGRPAGQTVRPLAKDLSIVMNTEFAEGLEIGLVQAALTAGDCVLICWIMAEFVPLPPHSGRSTRHRQRIWPNRYDLVAMLDREAVGWRFSLLGQRLLPGDHEV